ncbi:TPA: hypothetical protein I7138_20370 [Vibrio vulnificus]|jgi:hypothetical protein|nr:hypothetical protein [Vibrio vulnificus]
MKNSPKTHHVQQCVSELMKKRELLSGKKQLSENEILELKTLLHEAADLLLMANLR